MWSAICRHVSIHGQGMDELPHVIITHENNWDPCVLDHAQSDDQDWYDQLPSTPLLFPMFNEQGTLHHHIEVQCHDI